jgi:hypothetical protein
MTPEREIGWLSAGLLSLLLGGTSAGAAATPPDATAPEEGAIARLDGIAAGVRGRVPPPTSDTPPTDGEAAPERHAQGWQNWTNWGNYWQNA